ncbi:MAG: recombination mediator RecR [Bacteroidales bacterium]
MNPDNYPSRLLEAATAEFAGLPGIGKKTALRLVLHLLKQDLADVEKFSSSILQLKKEIRHCQVCHNISDSGICNICSDTKRDHSVICVVENIKDVMSIENTRQYSGIYHVLGGIISPMDGTGPNDLNISSLEEKVAGGGVEEVILALSTTMEGDTTNFYIYRKLNRYKITISTIARGISIGDELEYADEVTLGRSISNRTLFETSFNNGKTY